MSSLRSYRVRTRYLRCVTPGASIARTCSSSSSGPSPSKSRAPPPSTNDVQLELVDEPRRQVLVDDTGASADDHVLAGRGRPRLVEGRLDPLGHEGERRVRERQRLALVMRQHE